MPKETNADKKALQPQINNSITGVEKETAKTDSRKGKKFTHNNPTIDTVLSKVLRIKG